MLRFVGVDRIRSTLGQVDKGKFLPFFYEFDVDDEEELLRVKLTSYAYSLLNEFGNFMSFDMNEFCSFENKYTKTLFRLLKQYENLNSYNIDENSNLKAIKMNKNEFMKFMDTPSNYKMSHLDCRVMTPSLDELNSKSFSYKNLTYEKLYDCNNKNKKVLAFQIIFEKVVPK
ncbi:replication initiation protein [Campylobacter upsaliensis]|nr:RepB family plasmid replication initiator protein [Campylobacter upsaliensis]ECQ8106496.1 replication initiation protein [Campylobacter upsaliensis]EGK8113899.1 replication initiation protein [Campylobacter upsaliensis]